MINDTLNTNATNEGDFEAFKVAMGVKPNLPYCPKQWLENNWRTIERLMIDKDCVLSYKEYKDVLQDHNGYWDCCFSDPSLWRNLIDDQNGKGAWVEDDEQVILELITRYAHKLYERRAFDIDEYYIDSTLWKIREKIMDGYSITGCRLSNGYLYIDWRRTSREKSNAFGIYDNICALFKSLMRKETVPWEEKNILTALCRATRNSIGWKNNVDSWVHAYMMSAVPKLGWEQTLAIADEMLRRNIARQFFRTNDYKVFGTYEHKVWNSEKRAHEIVVEDMGQKVKEELKWIVDNTLKGEMASHKAFIAKAEEFIAKVAA